MAERPILSVAAVKQQLSRLENVLSKADFDRLEALLPLFTPQQASKADLAACLATVAAGRTTQEQLADFRAFRQRLRRAASKAELTWILEVDSRKRSAPPGRVCWFSQPAADRTADDVARFSEEAIASLDTTTAINSRVVVSVAPPRVCFFVSYDTDKDRRLARNFLDRLQLDFRASKNYKYDTWDPSKILVGERPADAIAEALHKADFGLLLLSASWLGKCAFTEDLRAFVADDGKPVIPVALRNVETRYNLHGLEAHQLFWLELPGGTRKSFLACRSDEDRERFVLHLAHRIEQRLQRWILMRNEVQSTPTPNQMSPSPRVIDRPQDLDALAEELRRAWKHDDAFLAKAIHARMQETSLRDSIDVDARDTAAAVVALDVLQKWALDPQGAPYCAILGEYGIGKTTTLKQFTAMLLKRRRDGEQVPLPIFIDLRLYSPTIHKGDVPNLETLLQEILDRVWETTHPQAFKAPDILRLVREEGAILIFDGLDEKLVHLDETQGRAFLRTLWNALPPFEGRPERVLGRAGRQLTALADTETQRPQGRLIFSCRSHYFKTLRDQNAMLRGEDRDGVRATDYRAWVLLPFNEEQIREYLGGVLGMERVEPALALFASVHNLRELAERPYLLSLIASHIENLERRRARGDVVRGVTLYDLLVQAWLKRDGGKHHWREEDKLTLMEDIAADMWQDGAREWEWRRVLAWLGKQWAQDEVLRTRYASTTPEILEEDFRTATFVLRPDNSQESFRFAHTSLQEYFLARYLLRTLVDNAPEKWQMPFPSPETLDFLGQLIATSPARQQEATLRVLAHLLGSYRPQATDIALRYWLLAVQHDLPAPTPGHVDLHSADLSGLTIRGRTPQQPLNLVDANLSGTHLVATRFEYVDLSGANLTRAQAEHAEFHDVLARDITVTEADMTAAIWRHCDALSLRGGASADWYECQWITCDIHPDRLPEHFGQQGALSYANTAASPIPYVRDGKVTTVFGHSGRVQACGFSPDGALVVSGADDGMLKLWDMQTGEVCMTVVYAPHGQTAALDERNNRILAASPEAWRYLGWRYFDPHANRLRILPAEHFGPLPEG